MEMIALVTLVRTSPDATTPTEELIEQIREAVQTSRISKDWSIEKISIL